MARNQFRFSFPFRVRYSEIDGQRILFNAHYLTFFDTTITEYFRNLPYDYMGQVKETGTDFHTVRTLVEFKAPVYFDEEIQVHVRVSRLGRSSITFALEMHPAVGEDLRATGEVVWVNALQDTHQSAALPGKLREKIVAFEGDHLAD